MQVHPRSIWASKQLTSCINHTPHRMSKAAAHAEWLIQTMLQNKHLTMEQVVEETKAHIVIAGQNMGKLAEGIKEQNVHTEEGVLFFYWDSLSSELDNFLALLDTWIEYGGKDDVYVPTY